MQLFAVGHVCECGERLLFCHMYIYIYSVHRCPLLFEQVFLLVVSYFVIVLFEQHIKLVQIEYIATWLKV